MDGGTRRHHTEVIDRDILTMEEILDRAERILYDVKGRERKHAEDVRYRLRDQRVDMIDLMHEINDCIGWD